MEVGYVGCVKRAGVELEVGSRGWKADLGYKESPVLLDVIEDIGGEDSCWTETWAWAC